MNGYEPEYNHNNYLNGLEINEGLPPYLSSDLNKILRVNSNATGVEWTDESTQNGFKADTGNGSTNTNDIYEGFVFNNNVKTGLFNYGPSNETLSLSIVSDPIISCESDKLYIYKNVRLANDDLLTTPRIGFGQLTAPTCFISGTSTTSNNNKISFSTDSQQRFLISTNATEHNKTFQPLQIDSNISFGSYRPHIYSGVYNSSNCCGLSFEASYNRVNIQCGIVNPIQCTNSNIEINEPLRINQAFSPNINIIEGTAVTYDTNGSNPPVCYMKRSTIANSDLIWNIVSSSVGNAQLQIITDGNGNASANVCRFLSNSSDTLTINGGTRTLTTSGNYITLGINATYTLTYVQADSRFILSKTS